MDHDRLRFDKGGGGSESGSSGGGKTGLGIEIEKAHALLIGVGAYRWQDWSIPVASSDVDALGGVLSDPEHAGYPSAQVTRLTDAAATRRAVLEHLGNLAEVARQHPESTILVYFSGHGWVQDGRYYLLTHEVAPGAVAETALPAEDFMAALRRIEAGRLLVMLDTCHAEGMADAKGSKGAAPEVAHIPAGFTPRAMAVDDASDFFGTARGRAVFLSCQGEEKSWYVPGERLSFFTRHLIEALRGEGVPEGRRVVTVANLMATVSERVIESAERIGRSQTPHFKFDASDFPVARVPTPSTGAKKPSAGHRESIRIEGDVQIAGRDVNRAERDFQVFNIGNVDTLKTR